MLHAASRLQALDLSWREQPGVVVLNGSDRFLVLNAVNQEDVVWNASPLIRIPVNWLPMMKTSLPSESCGTPQLE